MSVDKLAFRYMKRIKQVQSTLSLMEQNLCCLVDGTNVNMNPILVTLCGYKRHVAII